MRWNVRLSWAFAMLALFQAVAAGSAMAAPITVCLAGPPACDHASIQAAVDAAPLYSTIEISAGVWNESVVINKQLTVRGPWASSSLGGGVVPAVAPATIRGAGTGDPALRVGAGAQVSGMDVTGVVGEAGVVLEEGGRLDSSWVHDNTLGIRMIGAGAAKSSVQDTLVEGNNEVGTDTGLGIFAQAVAGAATSVVVRNQTVAGIRVRLPTIESDFYVNGSIATSPVGIDAAGPGRLHAAVQITVPPSGTGLIASGVTSNGLYGSTIAAAPESMATTGVVFDGVILFPWVTAVDLLDLDVPIKVGSAFSSQDSLSVQQSRIRQTGRDAVVVNESSGTITIRSSLVSCTTMPCQAPLGRGGPVQQLEPAQVIFEYRSVFSPSKPYVPDYLEVGQTSKVYVGWSGTSTAMRAGAGTAFATLGATGATLSASEVDVNVGVPITVTPTAAGEAVFTATIDGHTFSSQPLRVYDPAAELLRAPKIHGIPQVGHTLACDAPAWNVTPATITFEWHRQFRSLGEKRVGTGRRYLVRPFDAPSSIRCIVKATWPTRLESAASSRTAAVTFRPRWVVVLPVTSRGYAMGCGLSGARPCKVSAGGLVRFAVHSRPVQVVRTNWVIERRQGRSWRRASSGRYTLPSRFYRTLETTGAPAGLYRIRAAIDRKGNFGRAVSPWRYWRVG